MNVPTSFLTIAMCQVEVYVVNLGLQVSIPNSLCTPYSSTLHATTVKKEAGTFRIGKLFYSF